MKTEKLKLNSWKFSIAGDNGQNSVWKRAAYLWSLKTEYWIRLKVVVSWWNRCFVSKIPSFVVLRVLMPKGGVFVLNWKTVWPFSVFQCCHLQTELRFQQTKSLFFWLNYWILTGNSVSDSVKRLISPCSWPLCKSKKLFFSFRKSVCTNKTQSLRRLVHSAQCSHCY